MPVRDYDQDRLGLAIVKELAESMGGGVRAASDPGRGTRFTIDLPVA